MLQAPAAEFPRHLPDRLRPLAALGLAKEPHGGDQGESERASSQRQSGECIREGPDRFGEGGAKMGDRRIH